MQPKLPLKVACLGRMEEDALIEAVLRVRTAGGAESAAQVLAVLEGEGLNVTLSQVKKACSKASKRTGGVKAPAPAPQAAEEGTATMSGKQAKAAAREKNAAVAELKAAESIMMEAHRKLRAAKAGGDEHLASVTISGSVQEFIQQATTRAIAAQLERGDEAHIQLRADADVATLEWVKLAQASGALSLTEDVVALGGEIQLTRLKEARGGRDHLALRACYAAERRAADGGAAYQEVDRIVAQSGGGGLAPGAMDEMD